MLQLVNAGRKSLADYASIATRGLMDEIRGLAEPLRGARVLYQQCVAYTDNDPDVFILSNVNNVGAVEVCAAACLEILADPVAARARALAGKEDVRQRFLTPRLVRDWLVLFNRQLGNDVGDVGIEVIAA